MKSERSPHSGIIITDRRGRELAPDIRMDASQCGSSGLYSGYDGALSNNNRTDFRQFPTNSRRELNSYTRKELVRKIRALDANLGIYSRIKSKTRRHSVGKGIRPEPVTQDADWNELNKDRFCRWADNPGVYSIDASRDFWEDQGMAAETLIADGEYFEALVKTPNGAPMVQPLDVFEVESPWGSFYPPADSSNLANPFAYEDGVRTNEFLRPIGYAVRELPSPYSLAYQPVFWRELPALSMVHIFKRRRQKQVRGLTWFYSGVNSGIDALEITSLIKGTAKLHSSLAVAVRKKKAEAGTKGISADLQKELNGSGQVTRVNENFWQGAMIEYLATDEGIDLLQSDRPSENLLHFIDFLYNDIAIAIDCPKSVIMNMAQNGGPAVRADMEDAQSFFELVQDTIAWRHSQRIYVWNTAIALKTGAIRPCKDPQWWNCEWHGPAKITVDLKYTADTRIKLIKNGALSLPRLFEEMGQNAKTEWTRQMDFLQWARAEAAKRNIPFELLIEPTPGAQAIQDNNPSSSAPAASGSQAAAAGQQTFNISVDAKAPARRSFAIKRADGTTVKGELVDAEE
jgi:capsid protein